MNIFLFLSIFFLMTLVIGKYLENMKVPWIFASLFLGAGLSLYNPFLEITSSSIFSFLAQLGMFYLLFMVGFELDLAEFKKNSKFIISSTFIVTIAAAAAGSLLFYFLFNLSWAIALLVGLSFATVGEALLIPILDEFNIINKPLGQAVIGIGTLDDIFEILTLVLVAIFITSQRNNIYIILAALIMLFVLAFLFTKIRKEGEKFRYLKIETLFVLVTSVTFLFIGIGQLASAAPLAALLSGVSLRTFIPKERLNFLENDIKTLVYGLFAPIFFLWVGTSMNLGSLTKYLQVILLVVLVTGGAKVIASIILGFGKLGFKQSLLLGIGLTVRFSTSIVIISILLNNRLISTELYSVLVSSSVVFTFLVPPLFSKLLTGFKLSS